MYDNIDELIEINLNLLGNSNDRIVLKFEFVDKNGDNLDDQNRFAEHLEQKRLIKIEPSNRQRCDLTETGYEIFINGGWIAYLVRVAESEAKQQIKLDQREQLEIELAKSNIEANKLNERVAKQNTDNETKNRKAMWINIVIGVLNALLLAWSILKD